MGVTCAVSFSCWQQIDLRVLIWMLGLIKQASLNNAFCMSCSPLVVLGQDCNIFLYVILKFPIGVSFFVVVVFFSTEVFFKIKFKCQNKLA